MKNKTGIITLILAGTVLYISSFAAEKTFKDYMDLGNKQFVGNVAARDYNVAKNAAQDALKIVGNAQEKSLAIILMARSLDALGDDQAANAQYELVLMDSDAPAEQKADVHRFRGLALRDKGKWDEARAELEKIFALDVSDKTKNNAQREVLIAWDKQGKPSEIKALIKKNLAQQQEAWPGQNVYALGQAAALLRFHHAADALECYLTISQLPGVKDNESFHALRMAANLQKSNKKHAEARALWNKALKINGINDRERWAVLLDVAQSHLAESDFASARKIMDELALEHFQNNRITEYVSVICEAVPAYADDQGGARKMLEKGLALEGLKNRQKIDLLLKLADLCGTSKDFNALSKAITQLLEVAELNVNDCRVARVNAIQAVAAATSASAKQQAAAILEKILLKLAAFDGVTPKDQLTLALQAAGLRGVVGDFTAMNEQVEAAFKQAKEADLPTQIEALWDAAVFYMNIRVYDVARSLTKLKDSLHDDAVQRNTYACAFIQDAPLGAGGWALSDFIKTPKNKESRFQPYPKSGEGYALISDVLADRPLNAAEADAQAGRDTSFFMAYDVKGWHIYIQTDEPDIEKIMLENGRRGSTLEMFFSPGLERVPYYQWILGLAKGDVNLYYWDSPYRSYRHLKNEPGSFQTETVVLEKAWGSAIFIPWECLYDKLPFMDGNDDTWRFSIMRWGPVSMTWGGKVHETGRWGLIKWQAPTPAQKTAVLQRLIQRAWWKYNDTKGDIIDFWNCPNKGDRVFYETAVKPLVEKLDAYKGQIESVPTWEQQRIMDVFKNIVPLWMEFNYEVETLREQYLLNRLVDYMGF